MGYQFRFFVWAMFLLATVLYLASSIQEGNILLVAGSSLFLVAETSTIAYLEFLRERDHGGD